MACSEFDQKYPHPAFRCSYGAPKPPASPQGGGKKLIVWCGGTKIASGDFLTPLNRARWRPELRTKSELLVGFGDGLERDAAGFRHQQTGQRGAGEREP